MNAAPLIALVFAMGSVARADSLLLLHGNIYTGNPAQPKVEAVYCEGGRVVFVGTDADARRRASAEAKVVDLHGQTMLPGFTDAHAHLAGIGFRELNFNLEGTTGLADLQARMQERAKTLGRGQWLIGRGWIETHWNPQKFPTRQDLDQAVPDRPVLLRRSDGHAVVVNSLALKVARIDRTTPNPSGGEILHDASGEPTGLLVDNATDLILRLVPPPSEKELAEALVVGAEREVRLGWTQVHVAGNSFAESQLMERLIGEGKIKLRILDTIGGPGPDADELFKSGPVIDAFDGRFTRRGIKLYIDGALGSRGAALLEPYSDAPQSKGLLVNEPADLRPLLVRALKAGLQIQTHAIGDRGNRVVLDLYEEAFKAVPVLERKVPDPRWRIEHAQILSPTDIPRFAQLGVIPSMQASHAIGDLYFAPARLGPERLKGAYAWRSLIDAGSIIPGGSDAPVERGEPMIEFYAAVARKSLDGFANADWHLEQRVTRDEALKMFTLWPAQAVFQEKERGTIEVGKEADFTVLSADIMTIPEPEILKTRCTMTVIAGEVVYENADAALLPPTAPWHGASEALVAAADDPWITPAETTALTDTPDYATTIAYLRRLCAASPFIRMVTFGHTPEGRDLTLVIASREGAADPAALRANGRPSVLVQAGIHAGEIDGKDAGLMLLRDIAFRGKASLLEKANLLFIPVLNADGHERASAFNRPNQRGPVRQGWRTTAQNLNLNRDYMKADTPEMRALLTLLNAWQPALYLDIHVTDGIDYQYDVTFGYNGDFGEPCWSPHLARWLDGTFRPAVSTALEQAGHVPGHLVFAVDDHNLAAGLGSGLSPARYSNGYGDLRHLPTILVENHSLKPYRQRVLGTYVLLESTLRVVGNQAAALAAAASADCAARLANLPVTWADGPTIPARFLGKYSETYRSIASGQNEVRWTGAPRVFESLPRQLATTGIMRPRPRAYWISASRPEVIDRLRLHGVRMVVQSEARTLTVETYRLVDPKPASAPFEGRYPVATRVRSEVRSETFPKNSVRVPTDQPLGDLAMILLEPEARDSLLAWGFFPEILQRTEYMEGYVIAPLGDRMLVADPKLRAEFDAKLKADPAFAGDAEARLRWFYERSPYFDERYLLYPVGIER